MPTFYAGSDEFVQACNTENIVRDCIPIAFSCDILFLKEMRQVCSGIENILM